MGVLISNDWDAVKDKVPTWEKTAGNSPAFLSALGRRYSSTKQYADAEKILLRYIHESADRWAYEQLAANAKAQGDMSGWKCWLDQYLAEGDDHGLDHARVQVEIAQHYMDQKQWAQAKDYAEAAAPDVGELGHGLRGPLS